MLPVSDGAKLCSEEGTRWRGYMAMQVESKHQDAHRTSAHEEDRWYAAYTRPNHEKKVAEQLDLRNIEQLLPLYSSIRQWKDRKVRLMRPLFPGYVFVRMSLQKRLQVLEVPGIA